MRRVVRIGENLTSVFSGKEASEAPAGSAAVLLRAMREPPHLSDDDMDELEQAIVAGRQPMRVEGVFEAMDDT